MILTVKRREIMLLQPPRYPWLLLPFLHWARRIVLVDLSLLEFTDWSTSVSRFAAWLQARGLGGRVIMTHPIEYADLCWRANLTSVEDALGRVRPMRGERGGAAYYLGGYLAHRMQARLARAEYVRLLSAELVGAAVPAHVGGSSLRSITARVLASALPPLLTLLLPFALLAAASRWVRLVPRARTKLRGGICVDLCHGLGSGTEGRVSRDGHYTDTFLVEADGPFRLANHIFLGFGWQIPAIADWKCTLEAQGATVVGPTTGRTPMTPAELLAMATGNLRRWAALAWGAVTPVGGWCPSTRWAHFKYHLDLFRAQMAFHTVKPDAYLSRLDYNHRHHALGAECRRLGIHFAGICHSPLGGMAHTPTFAIVSFDTHLTYKPVFWERFYPSWQEAQADLRAVGVWRSDFIRQAEAMPGHAAAIESIRLRLADRFVVAIHLPVPQSYLYDRVTTEKWMGWFANLIRRHRDTAFILFPRRLHQAPDYFHRLIMDMLEPGRCELAEALNPAWTQSYPWGAACDFVVGCSYSDAVLEALACGIPSVSYADVGQGIAELEKFDATLSVYDGPELEHVLLLAREGRWPTQQLWQRLQGELTGEADGHCIDRIRAVLRSHVRNIESIPGTTETLGA